MCIRDRTIPQRSEKIEWTEGGQKSEERRMMMMRRRRRRMANALHHFADLVHTWKRILGFAGDD
eukprot:9560563-Prorocentrum_lima.AAC.1